MLLQAQNVTRRFGGEELFSGITFEIKNNARIGLVGRNGSGKSTLLKIIAGIEAPDEGQVIKRKELTIGFLDQHGGLESDQTIWDEMLDVFKPVLALEENMRVIEQQMADSTLNETTFQNLLKEYNSLQEAFERRNGYSYRSEIKMVLHGFQFFEEDYNKPIEHLSGGQKTRLSLAKLLLEKRELLILDEPTNHLDIETLSWLENYLMGYAGALVIVSHDRYFLDKLTSETYEISYGRIDSFKGNYSAYLVEKATRYDKQMRDFEKQQKEIADMEDFVARNLARASTTRRAQSRRKQLEKIDRIKKPQGEERSAYFSLSPERQSGNVVVQADELTIGYAPDTILSQSISFDIRKGDTIALIGPNGVGKSTLLKTIVQHIEPLIGEIKYGAKVDIGYYEQEQQNLNPRKTVLNEVWDDHPLMTEERIRTFLGSFLFTGEDVEKSVSSLSGGEQARVSIAKLALNQDNFLVLDEPTNHLDIDSKEVLENSLIDYEGTLLFVSHDRYFINRIANKILEINEEGVILYLGDYDYYLHKKEEQFEQKKARLLEEEKLPSRSESADNPSHSNWENRKDVKREIRRYEREIEATETFIETIEEELEALTHEMNEISANHTNHANGFSEEQAMTLTSLSETFDIKSGQLEETLQKWEILHEELLSISE